MLGTRLGTSLALSGRMENRLASTKLRTSSFGVLILSAMAACASATDTRSATSSKVDPAQVDGTNGVKKEFPEECVVEYKHLKRQEPKDEVLKKLHSGNCAIAGFPSVQVRAFDADTVEVERKTIVHVELYPSSKGAQENSRIFDSSASQARVLGDPVDGHLLYIGSLNPQKMDIDWMPYTTKLYLGEATPKSAEEAANDDDDLGVLSHVYEDRFRKQLEEYDLVTPSQSR